MKFHIFALHEHVYL